MLRMRIARAPLAESENRVILDEYNRLARGHIPMEEFVHWVRDNPSGEAWHAILETCDGKIVGHTSVFPLRTSFAGGAITPAKSEYSYLQEGFRKEKVEGFETAGKPAFIILLDELFKHCYQQGWGPIFASTNEKNQVFTRKVGLRPVEFPLWECLFILRPIGASRLTPNISIWHRVGLFSAGIVQRGGWSLAAPLFSSRNGVHNVPVGKCDLPAERTRLSFFDDSESLNWRYLAGQYVRYEADSAAGDHLIAKRGSPDRFLRVCQWRTADKRSTSRMLITLFQQAGTDRALGVRWAIYDGEHGSEKLVRHLRKMGFLCARRTRIVMVHKHEETYLDSAIWRMNDSLFSFDP